MYVGLKITLYLSCFALMLKLVECDHSVTVKQYCWECSNTNNTPCTNQYSYKVRCPEFETYQIPFYCFSRTYNKSATLFYAEKGCIRKDYYEAGYLCFDNLLNCKSDMCESHLCNSGLMKHAPVMVVFTLAFVSLLYQYMY